MMSQGYPAGYTVVCPTFQLITHSMCVCRCTCACVKAVRFSIKSQYINCTISNCHLPVIPAALHLYPSIHSMLDLSPVLIPEGTSAPLALRPSRVIVSGASTTSRHIHFSQRVCLTSLLTPPKPGTTSNLSPTPFLFQRQVRSHPPGSAPAAVVLGGGAMCEAAPRGGPVPCRIFCKLRRCVGPPPRLCCAPLRPPAPPLRLSCHLGHSS